ncbi:uncharacterized protein CDV56_108884 [Aspergillus thermomutatus]|uniref:ferric-chelate reductase (NADPH) n=1 Tax=Aspergillus thermomutatus TaxID=41047 RepID=A0A397HWH0_ASPTH|nr:uncharacterized protein CDV56_108884 [Aspergillus thermomutatus]RHZ67157.1 hypothetical protein CDV56_108884 [Aspergillus thermomutatus]
MNMDTSSAVPAWFANLPFSDPRCNNDSCKAYKELHSASQAQISWASQFLYGHYVSWFCGIILAVFVFAFWLHQCRDWFGWSSGRGSTAKDRITALRRCFTYRRVGGRIAEYLGLPSFGVIALVVFFFFAAALMAFAQHPYYRLRRGFGSPPLAVRTGLMAFALMPVEIALAGKYNLITLLTGIGHEKLNVFHRWIGYLMLFLSLIHTVPFLYQPVHEGGMAQLHAKFYAKGSYEFTGTPPFGMLVALATLSIPPIRRQLYEIFVSSHILLAMVFFGLCFWHAGQELDSWNYLWATLALWIVSYLGRIFGRSSAFRLKNQWLSGCPTFVYPLPDNMVRLEVHLPGPEWKWEPGQHVFLRFAGLRVLENHPFTIANACLRPVNADPEKLGERQMMKFLVRPQAGFTARLHAMGGSDALSGFEGRVSTIVEGPYGTILRPRVQNRYDTVVLVAGGGGISAMLPWLEHLSHLMSMKNPVACVTKRVSLLWVTREPASVQWVENELREVKRNDDSDAIRTRIWITGGRKEDPTDVAPASSKDAVVVDSWDAGSKHPEMDFVDQVTHQSRPNLMEVLGMELSSERTMVIGCGPESLKIDLSNAVARLQSRVFRGEAWEVRLHTDTFGW